MGRPRMRVGITNSELPFHAIPVPLPVLLLDILIPLECLDEFTVDEGDLHSYFSNVIRNWTVHTYPVLPDLGILHIGASRLSFEGLDAIGECAAERTSGLCEFSQASMVGRRVLV